MRLAILSENASPRSGADVAAMSMLTEASAAGIETLLLTAAPMVDSLPGESLALQVGNKEELIQLRGQRAKRDAISKIEKRIFSELARFSPDIVHIHNHEYILRPAALRLLSETFQTFVTMHDEFVYAGYHYQWVKDGKLIKSQDQFSKVLGDQKQKLPKVTFVSPSNWLGRRARHSEVLDGAKPIVTPNFSRTVSASPKLELRDYLFCPISDTRKSRKGFDVALEGFLRYRAKTKSDQNPANMLVGTFESLGLSEIGIHTFADVFSENHLASADWTQMQSAYKGAMLTVIPSRAENFANVGVESLLCGTPIVVSDSGGNPELLQSDIEGSIFRSGDDFQLGGAIENVLSQLDSESRNKIKRNAAQRFSNSEALSRHRLIWDGAGIF